MGGRCDIMVGMTTIRCSEFVKRQTRESRFSYYEGDWESLELLAHEHFMNHDYTAGNREGVIIMHVNHEGFYSNFFGYQSYQTKKHTYILTDALTGPISRSSCDVPAMHRMKRGDGYPAHHRVFYDGPHPGPWVEHQGNVP